MFLKEPEPDTEGLTQVRGQGQVERFSLDKNSKNGAFVLKKEQRENTDSWDQEEDSNQSLNIWVFLYDGVVFFFKYLSIECEKDHSWNGSIDNCTFFCINIYSGVFFFTLMSLSFLSTCVKCVPFVFRNNLIFYQLNKTNLTSKHPPT